MDLTGRDVVVTGGAGFVGSHLAERLSPDNDVTVVDDCSNGRREWVPDDADFVAGDCTDPAVVAEAISADVDAVFHFAAAKLVDTDQPRRQFEDNVAMTYNVLERMCDVGVRNLAYTSSSTVYGEAPRPTPEDYAPLEPISAYGAAKLAEGAVVPDFIEKLRADPDTLEILGDGRQEKSYMHIEECLDAMLAVVAGADGAFNVYNLGTRTTTSVDRIADIVAEEMGLDLDRVYTGGDRGWTGDVPRMRLSVEKLAGLGWEPSQSSDEAVRQATRELLAEL
ncbi:MAG: UDP-glucose 4-epimerase [Halobacteriales archaeon SW_9_67_25]|nr:MAG: UDP-glucose 4-epimerase [Halobacteriales archaeon SW_9_67_25]